MISRLILDRLIPLPTEDEEMEHIKAELERENYPITNLKSGGIFYMLVRIVVRIKIELLSLFRQSLSNYFIDSADDINWLSVRAADFQIFRKQATKTIGKLQLTRKVATSTIKIKKGCIFKTEPDSTGEELRFLSTSEVVFPAGTTLCIVPIEAEIAGTAYNIPPQKITRCLIHLETVTGITNIDDWIAKEGSDIEDIESLRSRLKNVWAELSALPIRDKYKSVCEKVPGVLYIGVNDQHPRGQGTVDIIVTSATGSASEALMAEVKAAALSIAGPYDDLLIKPSQTVTQDVAITIVLLTSVSDEGVIATAEETIRRMFVVSRDRVLNELYVSDLIVAIKAELPTAKSIRVLAPAADVQLTTDKVIVLGDVAITIERV